MESDHRFIWYLCKLFNTTPDDPKIIDMDPIQKLYMHEHWLQDEKEKAEQYKNHAYLIGGFSNPEMLQKIIQNNNGYNNISSSEEDFEKSLQMVKSADVGKANSKSGKRRKRKKIGT